MKKPLTWLPLNVDSWLLGSTRHEMTHEQRAVWVDLLVLAAKDEGYIRAGDGDPYPIEHLSNMLRVPMELMTATIDRCLEKKKLTRMADRTLYVTKWKDFQLTRRYHQMLEAQVKDDWAAKKTKELEDAAKNPERKVE